MYVHVDYFNAEMTLHCQRTIFSSLFARRRRCSKIARLPWQLAGIKFTQCVSGQKSAFSHL